MILGLIFGIWNSHTSIGNILGTLIAGYYVESNWGNSFIVPGLIMALMGFLVFLFLVVYPEDVGCTPAEPSLPSVSVACYFRPFSLLGSGGNMSACQSFCRTDHASRFIIFFLGQVNRSCRFKPTRFRYGSGLLSPLSIRRLSYLSYRKVRRSSGVTAEV